MLLENFKDTLFICIKLLEESKIDYSVIGGIAVNIWGFPRSTMDIDLTILSSQKKLKHFLQKADATGFSFQDKKSLIILKFDKITVDLILAETQLQKDIIARSKKIKFDTDDGRLNIKVIDISDLIVLKLISGRRIDITDIKNILIINKEKTDLKYIKRLAREWDTIDLLEKIEEEIDESNKKR